MAAASLSAEAAMRSAAALSAVARLGSLGAAFSATVGGLPAASAFPAVPPSVAAAVAAGTCSEARPDASALAGEAPTTAAAASPPVEARPRRRFFQGASASGSFTGEGAAPALAASSPVPAPAGAAAAAGAPGAFGANAPAGPAAAAEPAAGPGPVPAAAAAAAAAAGAALLAAEAAATARPPVGGGAFVGGSGPEAAKVPDEASVSPLTPGRAAGGAFVGKLLLPASETAGLAGTIPGQAFHCGGARPGGAFVGGPDAAAEPPAMPQGFSSGPVPEPEPAPTAPGARRPDSAVAPRPGRGGLARGTFAKAWLAGPSSAAGALLAMPHGPPPMLGTLPKTSPGPMPGGILPNGSWPVPCIPGALQGSSRPASGSGAAAGDDLCTAPAAPPSGTVAGILANGSPRPTAGSFGTWPSASSTPAGRAAALPFAKGSAAPGDAPQPFANGSGVPARGNPR